MMITSSGILQSYLIESLTTNNKLRHEELLKRHHEELIKRNLYADDGGFLTPLNFYLGILADTDAILISYMTPERKAQLTQDLQVTYLLLLAQREYEITHQKTENKQDYSDKIQTCESLLDKLNPVWQKIIKRAPEQEYFYDGKPVKYLGVALAKEFVDKLADSGNTKTIKKYLGALNEKRLYWVWGSSFLKTALSLVPDGFYNAIQAGDIVKIPDPYTGSLSWGLYYFRFSLNLFLLLKHTISHPWMSKEEASVPAYDRFRTQWALRKFTLLNDSLWGVANMLCFFWLVGKGVLGTAGDALTVVLLLFDASVAIWDFEEQRAQHAAEIAQFDADLQALQDKINGLAVIDEESKLIQRQLEMQRDTLLRAKKQCIKEWTLQKVGLYVNIAYAVGLMLAFAVLAMPFVPLTAATSLILGVAGGVLCFALTVLNNAIRGGLEIHKMNSAISEHEEHFAAQVELLKDVLKNNPELVDNERKLLYLEIKRLDAKTEHQRQMVILQSVHLVRSIMLEVFIPAAIFSCLVFCPLGIGLGILGGALGLAIASAHLINTFLTPDERRLNVMPFDEAEYNTFCYLANEKGKSYNDLHAFFRRSEAASAQAIRPTTGTDKGQPTEEDDSSYDGTIPEHPRVSY